MGGFKAQMLKISVDFEIKKSFFGLK